MKLFLSMRMKIAKTLVIVTTYALDEKGDKY